jgi:hypothetical protein
MYLCVISFFAKGKIHMIPKSLVKLVKTANYFVKYKNWNKLCLMPSLFLSDTCNNSYLRYIFLCIDLVDLKLGLLIDIKT